MPWWVWVFIGIPGVLILGVVGVVWVAVAAIAWVGRGLFELEEDDDD